jgi:hypothetical protein
MQMFHDSVSDKKHVYIYIVIFVLTQFWNNHHSPISEYVWNEMWKRILMIMYMFDILINVIISPYYKSERNSHHGSPLINSYLTVISPSMWWRNGLCLNCVWPQRDDSEDSSHPWDWYPLVNKHFAIKNGHRNSWCSH